MVQTATGAIDSVGVGGSINGEATAAGISMSLGAVIKRHKRTLINFQDSFLDTVCLPRLLTDTCSLSQNFIRLRTISLKSLLLLALSPENMRLHSWFSSTDNVS
jgi:hypothetical protein